MKKLFGFLLFVLGVLLFFKIIQTDEKDVGTVEVEKKKTEKKLPPIVRFDLTKRQQEILKIFKKRYTVLPSDIYAVAPELSTRTLRRDMDKLVSLGLVLQEGSTKDTRYFLKK